MRHQVAARTARVLVLTDSLENGGAERQLAMLLQFLPPAWRPSLWSLSDGPFAQTIRDFGVEVRTRTRAWRSDPRPLLELWVRLCRWRPDIVHSWGWMCSIAAGPLCQVLGIPLVDGTIRTGSVPPRRSLVSRLALRWATRIIANSQAGLDAWGIQPDLGRVVYNGFDADRLQLEEPTGVVPDQPFTAVMTGRMVWEKDFETYFAAARTLAAAEPGGWRFLAVGDGPERQRIESAAADLVVAGVVEFARPGTEVLPLVRRANVGVLISHPEVAEGCSNSIMEYMACALPVVCNNSGGNRELVADRTTGLLVPGRDPGALARALRQLRDSPHEAARLGTMGRERILHEFPVATMVQRTIAVYREALLAKRSNVAFPQQEEHAA